MAVDYGATTEDVNGLLQWDLLKSTRPSPEDVDRYLATATFEVNARLGDFTGFTDLTAFTGRARYVVSLFAAATAQEVAAPEIAGKQGSYASVLWARYLAALDQLATDVQEERNTGSTVSAGGAAHGFPAEALVKRDMGF